MAEQFSIPTVGDLIAGKYRVEEELGRGAYGVVFRAEQQELGRSVAVKTLLPQAFLQQDIVQRFTREAQLIGSLDHANIIRLWDHGNHEGLLYMAVEYVEGPTLMDLIENDAPLEPSRVLNLALQMLDALEHAHTRGIVHRDFKPENIILVNTSTTDGRAYEVVKILDFGISKLLRGEAHEQGALKSLTQDGTVLGTPHYMSPENIVGDPIDHRADLYAFGVILYEMLTGAHPFDAPSPSAVMVRHLRDDPPEMPEEFTDTALGEAIRLCLEKQPWDRIGSARELIELLEQSVDQPILRVSRRPSTGYRQPATPPVSAELEATFIEEPRSTSPPDRATLFATLAVVFLILSISIGWKLWLVMNEEAAEPPVAAAGETPPDEVSPTIVVPPDDLVKPVVLNVDAGGTEGAADAGTAAAMAFGESDAGDEDEVEPDEAPDAVVAPTPRPRPRDTSSQKPPAATLAQVEITSVPANASVTIDGVFVGSTPIRRELPTEKVVEVRFSHIGYKEKVLRVTPTSEENAIRANLERDHLELN